VAIDLEVEGNLTLGEAHDIASRLEEAVCAELGPEVEVETHIEPLQVDGFTGSDADGKRIREVAVALTEIAAEIGTIRDVHAMRVRQTRDGEIVNFHCHADPKMPVEAVHEKVDRVERTLRRRMPGIRRVIGHAEPTR
jgi:divalent metal cation (Fe/Co/Zn/Cd) transporter